MEKEPAHFFENPEQIKLRSIKLLAASLQQEWLDNYSKNPANLDAATGTILPRIKRTTDANWVEAHATQELDLTKLSFEELPQDWQEENLASAELAIDLVQSAKKDGRELDSDFIEAASEIMHTKWLERNSSHASADNNKPYNELAEAIKELDRMIIRKTIQML